MANEEKSGTKVFKFGKMVGVIFPDVYWKFVSKLHREHQDIVRAMTLAKVSIRDGSALTFLNGILKTNIGIDTPMDIGYEMLIEALDKRNQSNIHKKLVDQYGKEMQGSEFNYNYRPEEDAGKPIFDDPKHLDKFGQ